MPQAAKHPNASEHVSASRAWLPLALLASVVFWIVAWHGEAAARMAGIWWRSDTFAHGLVIYPVAAWLVWRRRAQLASVSIKPWFGGLLLLAAMAAVALLGDVGGVDAAQQFGLVAMIAIAVVVTMGLEVAKVIAFPLAFTLMAVPIGEFLLPVLMNQTADFTVAALRLTGVPVYREGLYFTVPTGRWSVVEACSGLRYLIASLTLGLLFAYLTYTTLWRRVLFVAASILVPIVANWVRAYTIVMIGHLSGMRYAVGADHLVYGWVFFGFVMMLLFWIGSWWREDHRVPAQSASEPRGGGTFAAAPLAVAALAVAAVAAAGPAYVDYLEAGAGTPERSVAAPAAANGWRPVPERVASFRPHYLNARDTVHQSYERDGAVVGVFIGYYAGQRGGAELIAFGNDLVTNRDRSWALIGSRRLAADPPRPAVREARLRSAEGELLAWQWYWAGGEWSVHAEEVKLRQALQELSGGGDDAAVVVIYSRSTESGREQAASTMLEFITAMEPSIRSALDAARRSGGNRSDLIGESAARPEPALGATGRP